ncbi:hypothetical protein HZC00_01745 [Candidatus Kaiserbacteria bacterium]|nr:hypothetical protein [Candidatus Kaiserbacteria bacterium]
MSLNVVDIVKNLLNAAGIDYRDVTETELAGQTIYSIVTKDSGASLIGFHSETIHAIDSLVKKIAEKQAGSQEGATRNEPLFLVDVNDHRTKQIKDLQSKALIMAERARSFQYDVELSPMSAYERLIVHTTLAEASNIKTESQGEGRNRRVVIKYAA